MKQLDLPNINLNQDDKKCLNSSSPQQQAKIDKNNLEVRISRMISQEQNEEEIDQRWSELKIYGPSLYARSYHSMVLYKDSIYIYGGYEVEQGIYCQFYKLQIIKANKFEWQKVLQKEQKINPGPRRRHISVVHKNFMYLYGGQKCAIENSSDFFSFDFEQKVWKQLFSHDKDIPPPIDSHNAVVLECGSDSQLVVFGGFLGGQISTYSNAVYSYNFEQAKWSILYECNKKDKNAPYPRCSAAACIVESRMFIFGGCHQEMKFDDLWEFYILSKRWEKIEISDKTIPEVRNGHSMVYYYNYLFIFGGIQDVTKERNDIYAFSIKEKKWKKVHTNTNVIYSKSPSPRTKRDNNKFIENKRQSVSPQRSPRRQQFQYSEQSSKIYTTSNRQSKSLSRYVTEQKNTSHSPENRGNISDSTSQQVNQIKENKKRLQLKLKARMLKDLEVVKPDEIEGLKSSSPITDSMKNSLSRIGNQRSFIKKNSEDPLQSSSRNLSLNTSKRDSSDQNGFNLNSDDQKKLLLVGKKPCARDGHACCLVNSKMLIFGGDRHLMSFNDLYFFDLDKAIDKHLK